MTSGDWLPRTRAARLSMAHPKTPSLAFLGVGELALIVGASSPPRLRRHCHSGVRHYCGAAARLTAAAAFALLDNGRWTGIYNALSRATPTAGVASMRDMKKRYFLMPPLTEEDIIALGLKLHDVKPSSHPAPKDKPVLEALPKGRGLHVLTVLNPNTNTKDKPEFVTGVVFAIRIRNANEPQALAKDMPDCFQASVTREVQWEDAPKIGVRADFWCRRIVRPHLNSLLYVVGQFSTPLTRHSHSGIRAA